MTDNEIRIKNLIDAIHERRFSDPNSSDPHSSSQCPATDEEVRFFIQTFMVPTDYYHRRVSTYGLKHICERVIGHLFRHIESYAYTSNDQFKRICEELHYKHRPTDPHDRNDPNWYIAFTFTPELKGIMEYYNQNIY